MSESTHRWLALDPTATDKRTIPDGDPEGLEIIVGFLPPTVGYKVRAGLFRQTTAATPQTQDELEAQLRGDDAILREAVRWGVRGWTGSPKALLEDGEIDGKKYPRLSEESLDRLFRNRLGPDAAVAVALFNSPSRAGKGGSGAS